MEKMKVIIEKVISGGYGFTRIAKDKVIFTPFTLPGEEVEVEITQKKRNFSFASPKEIIKSSPNRIKPICPLFGMCGGCQFQMTDYENQLEIKRSIIQDSIKRIAKLDVPVNAHTESDKPFNYRNKGSFQVFGKNELGFCMPGTTKPFSIKSCPLMEDSINNKIIDFLNNPEENIKLDKMKSLVIRNNHKNEIINSTIKRDKFMEKTAGLFFAVDVDTFFQVNRTIIPKWLEYIKNLIIKYKVGKGLLDLYSGVGTISQYLAPIFDHVIGIEINKRLVLNGNEVLKLNKIANAEFKVADASKFYQYGFNYDTVIINPPRKGISYQMVDTLIKAAPKVIIYSSCNPDTFARDIRKLSDGGYKIDEIQPFDMFPQTQHSEVVGVLYKK